MTTTPLEQFAEAEKPPVPLKEEDHIEALERAGYIVHKPKPQERVEVFDTNRLRGDRVKVAVVSDTHLGSNYQQLTHLRSFYQYAQEQGVDLFLHCGDLVDGSHKMHRDMPYHVFRHGYQAQRDYAVENYPLAYDGIKTYVISGNHDWSFVNGDGGYIVKDIASHRDDMVYLGELGAYFEFGDIRIYLHHPAGGVAYARSYKIQKWIEAVAPENKPHILLQGHFHIANHLPAYRNVEGFLVPCFQAQTPFLRRLALGPVIGGLILEFGLESKGLASSFKSEWVLFKVPVENDFPTIH